MLVKKITESTYILTSEHTSKRWLVVKENDVFTTIGSGELDKQLFSDMRQLAAAHNEKISNYEDSEKMDSDELEIS